MSSPLAIGAVSAVLRNLLDNGMIEASAAIGGTVAITAVAPDTIDLDSNDDPPRLNLFLHRVTHNQGWSNAGLPSRSGVSGERLTNAPLALDLHYMLTAYGRADFHAEILLGYAMQLLHERPVLDRAAIRRALDPSPIDLSLFPPALQALAASDLADQVELIKITPAPMSSDDMSRLWSAIQSHYRPSSTYQVSVVLIEGVKPAASPLPVLSRGRVDPATGRDRGVVVNPDLLPPLPTLFSAATLSPQTGARLNDVVVLTGVRLAGAGHVVRLAHRLFSQPVQLAPLSVGIDGASLQFRLPNDAAAQSTLAAGLISVSVRFTPSGEPGLRETNAIPLPLAPSPVIVADAGLGLPAAAAARTAAPPRVTVTMAARPRVRPEQRATLVLDGTESTARPRAAAADPLVFDFPGALAAGPHWVRLRVDGTDSILLDRSGPAPAFDNSQKITVPA
jgi:Pvc16 N-terminal domain